MRGFIVDYGGLRDRVGGGSHVESAGRGGRLMIEEGEMYVRGTWWFVHGVSRWGEQCDSRDSVG